MMSVGFVCWARGVGQTVWAVLEDIAAVAQPGDEVIIIDDAGCGHQKQTGAWAARFGTMRGWPDGVRVHEIWTGAPGAGDEGGAINIALAETTADRVIVLPGTARLDLAAFAAVRTQAAHADVVIAAAMAPDMIAADVPCDLLGRVLFDPALPGDTPCVEGRAAGGVLPLLRRVMTESASLQTCAQPMVHLPPPSPASPDWIAVWEGEARAGPEALDWALSLLPIAIQGSVAGERAVAGACLAGVLPDVELPDAPGASLIVEARARRGMAFRAPPVVAPEMTGRARIKIACEGPHAVRTPLAYPALAPLWEDIACKVDDPEEADLVVYAHPFDVADMSPEVAHVLDRRPDTPAVLLSEEPFWDSLYSSDPLAPVVSLPAAHLGECRLHQINHHRSRIYDFDTIPYFLLTEPHYAERYAKLFARNAALDADAWQEAFEARPVQAVFMAERRPELFHDFEIAAAGIVGLCAWRTRLAEGYQTGTVERLGASWTGAPTRFTLPDWHADKLAQLDGRPRILSALENTHQPTYISEKLFDAFACGARPLYMASPAHRLQGMGLPEEAWINLWGHTSETAVQAIDEALWDRAFFEAYAEAQSHLAQLWNDAALLSREHTRLGHALRLELQKFA